MGTFEELCEILTWGQLGFHHKPVALLNVRHYFAPLIQMLDRAVTEEFLHAKNRQLLLVAESIPQLADEFLKLPSLPEAGDDALRELT